jgi:hypothetical protein
MPLTRRLTIKTRRRMPGGAFCFVLKKNLDNLHKKALSKLYQFGGVHQTLKNILQNPIIVKVGHRGYKKVSPVKR